MECFGGLAGVLLLGVGVCRLLLFLGRRCAILVNAQIVAGRSFRHTKHSAFERGSPWFVCSVSVWGNLGGVYFCRVPSGCDQLCAHPVEFGEKVLVFISDHNGEDFVNAVFVSVSAEISCPGNRAMWLSSPRA